MNASVSPAPPVPTHGDDDRAAWAERVLLDQGMPPEEIDRILTADDPRVVRRHLELHRERLVEELFDRRRTLASLESELVSETQGSRTVPSSLTVQKGLCATSHG